MTSDDLWLILLSVMLLALMLLAHIVVSFNRLLVNMSSSLHMLLQVLWLASVDCLSLVVRLNLHSLWRLLIHSVGYRVLVVLLLLLLLLWRQWVIRRWLLMLDMYGLLWLLLLLHVSRIERYLLHLLSLVDRPINRLLNQLWLLNLMNPIRV